MSYLIALDQSTSGTKALLLDENATILDKASCPHAQHYPQPGWVEHDAAEIYANVRTVLGELSARHPELASEGICLSLTNQRETVVVFDRATGEPVHPAIVWQCRRGLSVCDQRADQAAFVRETTGLPLDTYFPAPKLRQLWSDRPDIARRVRDGSVLIGTIDSYLIYRLTKGRVFATDHTNASRTLLYDLKRRTWSDDLCELFDVPKGALPEIRDCDAHYGETDGEGALPRLLPIAGVIGDSQAALFAQCGSAPGSAKATLGTGSSVLLNVGSQPRQGEGGMVTALGWVCEGGKAQYALEGIINYVGATLHWLRDQLGLIGDVEECEALGGSVTDNNGVYLVPAFVGMGAPYWESSARAAILGLTPSSTRAHIARAALESIAYQITDVITAMERTSGQRLCGLYLDGGMTGNRLLLQHIADITGQRLRAAQQPEISAVGAALMGLLATGRQTRDSLQDLPQTFREYAPTMDRACAEANYSGWKAAVRTILPFSDVSGKDSL